MLADFLLALGAYLLGSLSTAILYCRLSGLPDPRAQGSGNPGATNVLRLGGRRAALITLLGDMLKGLLPVALAAMLHRTETASALIGLAAFLGHLYPLYFGFRGGKGVATALGVLLGLAPVVGALVIASWLAMALLSRISSLAALTAFALAPVYFHFLNGDPGATATLAVMSGLIFWRHRSNIRKLLAGTEPRIGSKHRQP